jgi:hypothetical protein
MNHIDLCRSFVVDQREMIRLKLLYIIMRLIFFQNFWVEYPNISMNARFHSIHVCHFTVSLQRTRLSNAYTARSDMKLILTVRNPSRFLIHHHSKEALSCRESSQCVGLCYSLYVIAAWLGLMLLV